MSADKNIALINRVLELINSRHLDEAFAFYDLDYIYHGPGGQELRGRSGIRGLWELFLAAFPDLAASVDEVFCAGNKVALRWTVRGTHTGEFLGIPASDKSITLPITEVFHIEDGILIEAWDQYDRLHLMEQIGAFPMQQEAHVDATNEEAVSVGGAL